MNDLRRIAHAHELPDEWDAVAAHYFQRRAFLAHAERFNPCRQRYYVITREDRVAAGACVYSMRLNLFTFAALPGAAEISIVGVPCSVSAPGLVGARDEVRRLVERLASVERGLLIGLNLDAPLDSPRIVSGRTLPSVRLDLPFQGWTGYRGELRSPYRRRLDRQLAKWRDVVSERGPCGRMDAALHAQYLEVFRRSRAKLERLSLDFLRHLPADFHLTIHRRGNRVLGWHIVLAEGAYRSFFLAGIDYATLAESGNYHNMLARMVKEAIEDGVRSLELGQTAEVAKTRLGGHLVEKSLFGTSSNAVLRSLLAVGRPLLEYRRRIPPAHVFHAPGSGSFAAA